MKQNEKLLAVVPIFRTKKREGIIILDIKSMIDVDEIVTSTIIIWEGRTSEKRRE